jgi:hypothetical protein
VKWATRERARVDRIACPWLIPRFVDARPEFLFVPSDKVRDVAKTENAIPYVGTSWRTRPLPRWRRSCAGPIPMTAL